MASAESLGTHLTPFKYTAEAELSQSVTMVGASLDFFYYRRRLLSGRRLNYKSQCRLPLSGKIFSLCDLSGGHLFCEFIPLVC
jgi:hypothetical protein